MMIRNHPARLGLVLVLLAILVVAHGVTRGQAQSSPQTLPSVPGSESITPVDVSLSAAAAQPRPAAQAGVQPQPGHRPGYTAEGKAARERAARGQAANSSKPAAHQNPNPPQPGAPTATPAPSGPTAGSATAPPAGPKATGTPAPAWGASPEAPQASAASPTPLTSAAPILSETFDGLNEDSGVGTGPPPDPTIAAGPNNIVTVVNDLVQVYSKSGTAQGSAASFTSLVQSLSTNKTFSDFAFDPWVVYDPYLSRFWLTFLSENDDPNGTANDRSNFYVLVSKSSDANDGWKLFTFNARIDGGTNNPNWCDYAKLGFDAQNIYVTCNMFAFPANAQVGPPARPAGAFKYVKIRTMGKSQFLSGACCLFGDLTDTRFFTMQPARMYGATAADGMFMVGASGGASSGSNFQVLHSPASPSGTWTLVDRSVGSYDVAPAARSSGTSTGIDTGDTRLLYAIWKGGHLTTGQNLACNGGAFIAMTELNVSAFPTVTVPLDFLVAGGGTLDYYFPALDINAAGFRVMVATRSGPSEFAGERAIGIDTSGQVNSDTWLIPGADAYNQPDSTGNSRWGDYSGASSDPDGQGIWLYGEYARSGNKWGTSVGLSQEAKPPFDDDFSKAFTIQLGQQIGADDSTATTEFLEQLVSCTGTSNIFHKTLWFQFTVPANATSVNIDTFGSSIDTVLAVYSQGSNPGNAVRKACNDDTPGHGLQSLVSGVPVTPNSTVKIQAGSFNTTGGSFQLNLGPGFTASPKTVQSGGTVTLSWNGIPNPGGGDFIALEPAGSFSDTFLDFRFLNCSKTQPTSAPATGTCAFTLPSGLAPGLYEFHLIRGGVEVRLSTSNAITVTAAATALTASPTSLAAGATLTASWSGIADPTARDWVGLYLPGADNKDRILWNYVSCSKTPGRPAAAGSCPFSLPATLAPGEYELRLYADDGFDGPLASSNRFTVRPPAPPVSLSVSPTSARAGDDVTVTWSGIGDPQPADSIALFRQGTPNSAELARVYLSCGKQPGGAAASGSCSFKLPNSLRAGSYEFRLFGADSSLLAISDALDVTRGRGASDSE
jgi:hypothetical protein